MRFEDMCDLQPFGARHFDIAFAIAARIDDRRLAARTDEIGQVGQAGRLDFFEQHICLLCVGKRKRPQRSEEHTSELQSLMRSSYAVFCLKKKKTLNTILNNIE